jgi:soluble lytic murein transglycosylase-like protein
VLGCLVLTGEVEVVHHLRPMPAQQAALPLTGGEPSEAAGELIRPQVLSADDRRAELTSILAAAAARHGLDPGLVMAVAWWESGWDMTKLSSTGAVGMMQIDPATAQDQGPKLLGRAVDVHDPYDNADLGAAVLAADLRDAGGDLTIALASYYEGSGNVDPSNLDAGAQTYVEGVTALQKRFDSGQQP